MVAKSDGNPPDELVIAAPCVVVVVSVVSPNGFDGKAKGDAVGIVVPPAGAGAVAGTAAVVAKENPVPPLVEAVGTLKLNEPPALLAAAVVVAKLKPPPGSDADACEGAARGAERDAARVLP